MFDISCQTSEVRRLMCHVRCLKSDVCCRTSYVRFFMRDIWCIMCDVCLLKYNLVTDRRFFNHPFSRLTSLVSFKPFMQFKCSLGKRWKKKLRDLRSSSVLFFETLMVAIHGSFWYILMFFLNIKEVYDILRILHGRLEIRNFSSSEIFVQHSKRNFVSPSGHVMFFLLYKHQWNTKPFHLIVFWCERRDLLCSDSKGDIFTCEDIKFPRESSPSISLVFI